MDRPQKGFLPRIAMIVIGGTGEDQDGFIGILDMDAVAFRVDPPSFGQHFVPRRKRGSVIERLSGKGHEIAANRLE